MKGYTFYSYCDSEVIAILMANQILEHGNIEKAHEAFIRNADGPFTYIPTKLIRSPLLETNLEQEKEL